MFCKADWMVLQLGLNGFATKLEWSWNTDRTPCHTAVEWFWNTLSNFSWPPYQLLWVMQTFVGQSSQVKMHAQKHTTTTDLCASKSNTSLITVSALGYQTFSWSGVAQSRRGEDCQVRPPFAQLFLCPTSPCDTISITLLPLLVCCRILNASLVMNDLPFSVDTATPCPSSE